MTNELAYFVYGLSAGFLAAGIFWFAAFRRMCRRIVKNHYAEIEAKKIEMRRYPTEFVNQDSTPPGAGPEGSEYHGFSVRPGALMLAKLAEKNAEKG